MLGNGQLMHITNVGVWVYALKKIRYTEVSLIYMSYFTELSFSCYHAAQGQPGFTTNWVIWSS